MEVIEFIERFKVARTSTIKELFYPSLLVAQKRLKRITEDKELKRSRDNITNEYIYFKNKPKQLKHSLLITDFYREFNKLVDINHFKNEFIIEGVRADALMAYEYKATKYISFLEVQISNVKLNLDKYRSLKYSEAYKKILPVFPSIIAVTNQRIEIPKDLEVIQIKEDLSNAPLFG